MEYAALGTAVSDSVGERIRRAVPHARVVTMPNAVGRRVRVGAGRVPASSMCSCAGQRPGPRSRCGADTGAEEQGTEPFGEFGRPTDRVLDLGGIRSARVLEMYPPLRLALSGRFAETDVGIEVRRAGRGTGTSRATRR
ncbi:hypothetical protein ACIP3A_13150 [Streptomyces tricolor]|uniref:hypothetical protein n=1 Tax=Streptomyces TaxID=1883 RepID=UPI000A40C379|nr:hypothetical protein [Streptomyces sp. PBH53]